MNRYCLLVVVVLMAFLAEASWYWPFGSSEEDASQEEKKEPPRLSELMEPASAHIENAFDLAAEGKSKEAIEEYRKALEELDKIEEAEPERSKTPEFASLRTKRAYVTQAIDSLIFVEVQQNAKAIAVTDTSELEKKLQEEADAKRKAAREKAKANAKAKAKSAANKARQATIVRLMQKKRFDQAEREIAKIFEEDPASITGLNLQAMLETQRGDFKAAEQALERAIEINPRSYHAYYNLAKLILERDPKNKTEARELYETGRAMGGEKNPQLEKLLK